MAAPPPIPLAGIFYSTCQTLEVGCVLYSDNPLVTPLADNFYADDTWCYQVFGNGEIIAKTSVAYCYATTSTTTTTTTTSPSGYYKFQAYILPYDAQDPYGWCSVTFGEGEADIVDFYSNVNDPSTNMVGDYISLAEATCQNSYNGLPIANYQLLWSPTGDFNGRKLFRMNNLCTVTEEWICF